MFGLSITKILFTVLLGVVVWKGRALANAFLAKAINPDADTAEKKKARGPEPRQQARQPEPEQEPEAIDLAPCPRCGVYKARTVACTNCTS